MSSAPAAAHTELRGTDPVADTVLDEPPTRIRLSFTDAVVPRFFTVTVAIDGGDPQPAAGDVDPGDATSVIVNAPQVRPAARQRWTVSYRVVSADGHPITGAFAFTVAPAGSTATPGPNNPSAAPASPRADTSPPASTSNGPPGGSDLRWLVVGLGVAAAAGLALFAGAVAVSTGAQTEAADDASTEKAPDEEGIGEEAAAGEQPPDHIAGADDQPDNPAPREP